MQKKADSIVSYTEEDHPIHWHKYVENDGRIINIFNEELKNRQEYQKTYYPNGAIFIFKKEIIFKRTYYTDKSYVYIMPKNRSVDIDTIEDFRYAEYLLRNRNE